MSACLFVIDVQQSFPYTTYFDDRDLPEYLVKQNQLIKFCEIKDIPIVRIMHTGNKDAFKLESGKVVPLVGLTDFKEEITIYKSRHSALVGTELSVWLVQNGIEQIIISGIRTEQCCETTARHASDLGYKVNFALDATLTFDMINKDGSILTSNQIKQRTQTVLQDRFANVVDVSQLTKK